MLMSYAFTVFCLALSVSPSFAVVPTIKNSIFRKLFSGRQPERVDVPFLTLVPSPGPVGSVLARIKKKENEVRLLNSDKDKSEANSWQETLERTPGLLRPSSAGPRFFDKESERYRRMMKLKLKPIQTQLEDHEAETRAFYFHDHDQ
ncbi:hypothetical protein F5148DRAFT_542424 [Russula earlei]|uniref:Uncharacterized protein n=1 Tax=Russula earlei TaxID=71964 RepID=A0ACC0UHU0_9AGAM|nr:hypothetical protein F5148DRAFT_542424 [Russula earlei]